MLKSMKLILAQVFVVCLVGVALMSSVSAATTNYAPDKPVVLVPFHVSGQYTADTTAVIKVTLPFKAKLIGVSATARASGGTTPTLTVDLLQGGTTVLSAPIAITAGTVAEGTVTTATLTDEASITVNLVITGTTPTWNDITILLTLVRL